MRYLLVLLLLVPSLASADSFLEGFARGFKQGIEIQRGQYPTEESTQEDRYNVAQEQADRRESLRLAREQNELLRQQIQKQEDQKLWYNQ